jgi:Plant protein of unknown function (DUF639)
VSSAALLSWHKLQSNGKPLDALTIQAPSSKNPVEQIFILQDCISRVDEIVKEVNITLLKLRTLIFVGVPKVCLMHCIVYIFIYTITIL